MGKNGKSTKHRKTRVFLAGLGLLRLGRRPAGPVRPSGPCCFGVAKAPFVSLGGWKTAERASFLVGSESNVRQWGPWPAGPVRPSGPSCFGCLARSFSWCISLLSSVQGSAGEGVAL